MASRTLADWRNLVRINDLHLYQQSVLLLRAIQGPIFPWLAVEWGSAKREPTSCPVTACHPLKSKTALPTLNARGLSGLYQRFPSPVRLRRKCCQLGVSITNCPG